MALTLRPTDLDRSPATAHFEDWTVFDDAKPENAAKPVDDNLFGFLNAKPKKQYATISVVKREQVVQHTVPVTGADGKTTSGQ